VFLRLLRQLASDLSLETGDNQTRERVTNAFLKKRLEGMVFGHQFRDCRFEYLGFVILDFDP